MRLSDPLDDSFGQGAEMEIGVRAECGRRLHPFGSCDGNLSGNRGRAASVYVAMTRAKNDLHLVVPQRFFTHGQRAEGDRHIYAWRTRFIPDDLYSYSRKRHGRWLP